MEKKLAILIISILALSFFISGCVTGQAKGGNQINVECNDRIDNDGDGLIDINGLYEGKGKNKVLVANPDTGCISDADTDESNCGDNICEGIETCDSCSLDCGMCPPICGDGVCELNESAYCSQDCVTIPQPNSTGGGNGGFCGDGVCETGESQTNCPVDCGTPRVCIDTDNGIDLEVSGAVITDRYNYTDECIDTMWLIEYFCDENDNVIAYNISCSNNYTMCLNGVCVKNATQTSCGDGTCQASEDEQSCPQDCQVLFSCDETDNGFDPENGGVTYGLLNGTGYNATDYCIANMTLVENYCNGDFSTSSHFDCSMNFTYCDPIAGACVR